MRLSRLRSIAAALGWMMRIVAVPILALVLLTPPVSAQSSDPKALERQQNGDAGKDTQKKVDEFAEAAQVLGGPASNPECVWLGRRAVGLLWNDDLDTAFRHLDLYDRFGCPSGHIQASFRCLILHSNSVDPKAPDSLNGRVNACWIDPPNPAPPPPPPAAAAPNAPANR